MAAIALADVRAQHHGGDALLHIPLYLARVVFHQRAARGDGVELVVGVGRRRFGKQGLQHSLTHDVRKAAIGRGGVGVVLHRQPEVAGRNFVGLYQHVLAGAHELDNGQGEIGKVIGILFLLCEQKIVERFGVGLGRERVALCLG